MPTIRPSSDLRNKYNEISALCHKYNEPVYLTKNGAGDLAVMSIEAYEALIGKFELRSLLEKGISDIEQGKTKSALSVFERVESRLPNE